MKIAHSVGEILRGQVTLEVECLDRLYLNVYVPQLQYAAGVATFLQRQRGAKVVSTALVQPMTEAFVAGIKTFAHQQGVPLVHFRKGERKDEVAQAYLARFTGTEGVLFIGVAQEKARLPRTERRRACRSPSPLPTRQPATAMSFRSCRWSARSRRCWTSPATDASCLSKSSASTSTWAALTRCN